MEYKFTFQVLMNVERQGLTFFLLNLMLNLFKIIILNINVDLVLGCRFRKMYDNVTGVLGIFSPCQIAITFSNIVYIFSVLESIRLSKSPFV